VCDKRALIIHKLEELLARLGARAVTLNDTDAQYRREAETALEVWLEVESIYRMSQEKFDEATQSSELVLQQMEVAEHVEKLCEKSVKQVIDEYPTKSAKINEEKEVVLDIIEMVDSLPCRSRRPSSACGSSVLRPWPLQERPARPRPTTRLPSCCASNLGLPKWRPEQACLCTASGRQRTSSGEAPPRRMCM
jgi:hypothetical protein